MPIIYYLKEPIPSANDIVDKRSLVFKYDGVLFEIPQLTATDSIMLEKLALTDYKFLLFPDIPALFPQSNTEKHKELLDLMIRDNRYRLGRYERIKTLVNYIILFLRPVN